MIFYVFLHSKKYIIEMKTLDVQPAVISFFGSFDFQQFLSAFIVLFAVIDIIGSIPIILDLKQKGRPVNAMKATLIAFVLLLGFGFVNASFFPGEILVLYALIGFVLVPVRHLSDKAVAWIALILMLQPLEWCKVVYALLCPTANPQQMIFSLADVYPQLGGHSLWEMIKVNFITGQLASLNWAWCYGRVFQTASLFMIGMLLGRKGLFRLTETTHEKVMYFWQKTGIYALLSAVLLYYLKGFIYSLTTNPFLKATLETIWNSWYNLAFMLVIVSTFLLLYWINKGKIQQILVPYGKMSLTDYVMQSFIGSFIYFGYGLEMHRYCGTTLSLLIGIVFFLLQLAFAHWWFRHFRRGPLETLWHKLTWIGKEH